MTPGLALILAFLVVWAIGVGYILWRNRGFRAPGPAMARPKVPVAVRFPRFEPRRRHPRPAYARDGNVLTIHRGPGCGFCGSPDTEHVVPAVAENAWRCRGCGMCFYDGKPRLPEGTNK